MSYLSEKSIFEACIGIGGCGAMGLPMGQALLAAGFDVKGFDVRPPEDFATFKEHMITAPEDFAGCIDILISVVRDEQQTLDLYFEKQAIFGQQDYPKICLLASTVSPRFISALNARLPADVVFFEIPMSGAPIAAEQARLSFMVGADEQTASPIRPLLEAMGRDLYFLGGLAKGMTCKVLNNFVAASSVAAVRQVLSEAARFDLAPEQLLEVMKSSSGGTWFGDNFDSIVWASEDFERENTIGILEKDVNSLLDALQEGQGKEGIAYIKAIRDRLSTLPPLPKGR